MNEEQGKPRKKVLLVRAAIILAAIGLLFITVKCSNSNQLGTTDIGSAYPSVKDDIQNAVVDYATRYNGTWPTLSGTYTNANCLDCNVINISALLVSNGGMLRTYPDGLNLSASGNDNCGGNAALGCSNGSSYIWIVDTQGAVFSYCAGVGCETNNSGYQDAWP
jgi:hypothetical protein